MQKSTKINVVPSPGGRGVLGMQQMYKDKLCDCSESNNPLSSFCSRNSAEILTKAFLPL